MRDNAMLRHVPLHVQIQVQMALTTLRDWNFSIHSAREMGRIAGSPGRYEWELRYAPEYLPLRNRVATAQKCLATFEEYAPRNGVDAEAIYRELGGREVLLPEGPHVRSFRPAPEEGSDAGL